MPDDNSVIRTLTRRGVAVAAATAARFGPQSSLVAQHLAPRILVIRPDHVGDMLLSIPALEALRAGMPHAHITALVGPWSADVLAGHPAVDDVQVFDFPGFARAVRHSRVRAYWLLLVLASRMRRWHIDVGVNLRPDFWWGACALAFAGVGVRVGFDLPPGAGTLTHRELWPAYPEHAAHLALRLVRRTLRVSGVESQISAPLDANTWPLTYPIASGDQQWASEWLERHGIDATARPLFVHPGAGAPVKLWTSQQWARTVAVLASELGAPVIVAGQPADAAAVQKIAGLLPPTTRVVMLTEGVSLHRYAAIISRSRLALGVDSGPLHLAVAVGTPSVRLHGPTDPHIFGPWGPPELHAVVAPTLPCAPCGRLDYEFDSLYAHPCVRLLPPAAVCAAARRVLAHTMSASQQSGAPSSAAAGSLR